MDSLAPQDATRFWLSRRACDDLFLLYCFTDTGRSFDRLRADVLARSATVADLWVRVRERRWAYPAWVSCDIREDQVVDHELPAATWSNVVDAVGGLLSDGLRADVQPWRLHLFRGVRSAPGEDAPALVAVLQVSHALADGQRAAAIARALWTTPDECGDPRAAGDDSSTSALVDRMRVTRSTGGDVNRGVFGSVPINDLPDEMRALVGLPVRVIRTILRGLAAERARRMLEVLTGRGDIPPPATNFPPTSLNRPPPPTAHAVRMIVRDDLRVPGRTVTVVALTAIAAALSGYLRQHGAPAERLGAQVSMARPVDKKTDRVRNNYVDLGIELPVDESDPRRRADRIAAELTARRTRADHPLLRAQARVSEVIPASLLRRDIAGYPLDLVPDALSGNTVISSVNRGPADLSFGGGPVRFTGGFPALGAVMHLTHGVHGLGATVTVSVHADPAVLPDIDVYADLVNTALTETVTALRG
ncbi:WS/DGAT domain-containing protein [Nocardia alni]|uniref:WS/DGAT domain-containing protein n=1 Tax=Nocardia alni TaxID=2815723 RepID=UPI001C239223|nr:WS/DGAT domain-containing protein [Nocardia alni]